MYFTEDFTFFHKHPDQHDYDSFNDNFPGFLHLLLKFLKYFKLGIVCEKTAIFPLAVTSHKCPVIVMVYIEKL